MSATAMLGQKPRPMREFREAIEFIKRYTAGEEVEFRGAKMRSEWIRRPIRVYLAVDGPKSCQMAGAVGDGALLTTVDPTVQKWRKVLVTRGAEQAGRDPSNIDCWARTMCYVAESKEAARREVASYAATLATQFYFSVLRWNTPEVEDLRRRMDTDLLDEIKHIHDVYDYYQHEQTDADHSKLVSQRVIDLFLLTGTPDDICEQISKLGPIGIRTVSMTIYTIIDKKGMMQEISDKILPHFRN